MNIQKLRLESKARIINCERNSRREQEGCEERKRSLGAGNPERVEVRLSRVKRLATEATALRTLVFNRGFKGAGHKIRPSLKMTC